MATQNSQLVQNLNSIYATKLQIKEAIGTTSDIFSDYPAYITNLKPSGNVNITTNGSHNVSSYATAYVTVEGGEIPSGYTYVSGTSYITENGDYDISSYQYVNVDIEGGGSGEAVDPWGAPTISEIINDGEDLTQEFPFINSFISDNCSYSTSGNDYFIEWDEFFNIDNNSYIAHFVMSNPTINAAEFAEQFELYPDLYDNVYPCVANCTITESEDPSEDGYNYLVEGEFYMMNQFDDNAAVEEITENGFIVNQGVLGYNVNIPENPLEGFITIDELLEGEESDYVRFYITGSQPQRILHTETDSVSGNSYIGQNSYLTFNSLVQPDDNSPQYTVSVRANLGDYADNNPDFCESLINLAGGDDSQLGDFAIFACEPILTNVTLTETSAYTYTAVGDVSLMSNPPEKIYPDTAGAGGDYWYAAPVDGDYIEINCWQILPSRIHILPIKEPNMSGEPYEDFVNIHVRPYDENEMFDDTVDYTDGPTASGTVTSDKLYIEQLHIDTSGESDDVYVVVTYETYSYDSEEGDYVANNDEDILFGPILFPAEDVTYQMFAIIGVEGCLANEQGRAIYGG